MIYRVKKSNDYTIVCNHVFRNKNISFKSKGLLLQMISMPDDWRFSSESLMEFATDGRDSVRTSLKELEEQHYLVRTRDTNDKGQFVGYIYDVYEKPLTEIPTTGNKVGMPDDGLSGDGKHGDILNTILPNTIRPNTNQGLIPPISPKGDCECEVFSNEKMLFESFRKIYRGTKRGLDTEFANLKKKHKDWRDVVRILLPAYERQCEQLDRNKAAGAFVPQPKTLQTYINQRCWEDEITEVKQTEISHANNQRNSKFTDPRDIAAAVYEGMQRGYASINR